MSCHRKTGITRYRQVIAVILMIILSAAVFSCSKGKERTERKQVSSADTGSVAPDFTLKDLRGRDVTLSQYRGKVVLLDFWATWCPPCRATIPELVAIQDKYKGKDFTVLGVSLDDPGENLRTELTEFSRTFHLNYPVLLGNETVEHDYKIWSIPRCFLIDKEGKIMDSYSGYDDRLESRISAELDRLL